MINGTEQCLMVDSPPLQELEVSLDGQTITTRLGEVTIYEDNFITFPEGLLGFENARHFVLGDIPGTGHDTNFAIMQSLEIADLCFVVFNATLKHKIKAIPHPHIVDIDVMRQELLQRDIDLEEYGLAFLVSINPNIKPTQITMNSSAPLIMSYTTSEARQVVIANAAFSVTQLIC